MTKSEAAKYFGGKKITVMGLGLLGRGVGDAKFLAECGADLIVTDLKTEAELAPSLKKLAAYKNIRYVLGEHRLEDFRNRDFILKAAGVPFDSPYIAEAEQRGIPVKMSASWCAELSGVRTIGVTGTRGKTTVTRMLEAILKAATIPHRLGGNIRGVATLPLVTTLRPRDTLLMELDSWQLQGFGDAGLSPHIAVFTTFLRDHQNYYHNDLNRYFVDKANIFHFQGSDDVLVTTPALRREIQARGFTPQSKIVLAPRTLPAGWRLRVPGEHNRQNAALALATARSLGIKDTVTRRALAGFAGVSGRLELVRTVRGVAYYNDTTATTPDALYAALDALTSKRGKIILIAGGTDAELDLSQFWTRVSRAVKYLVLFNGTATHKLLEQVSQKKRDSIPVVHSMIEALRNATARARRGDVVLLSPGAKSFGIFKNEYDRGDQFMKCLRRLS